MAKKLRYSYRKLDAINNYVSTGGMYVQTTSTNRDCIVDRKLNMIVLIVPKWVERSEKLCKKVLKLLNDE